MFGACRRIKEGNFVVALRCTPACGSVEGIWGDTLTQGVALGWYSVGPLALRVVVVTLSQVGGYGWRPLAQAEGYQTRPFRGWRLRKRRLIQRARFPLRLKPSCWDGLNVRPEGRTLQGRTLQGLTLSASKSKRED